MITVSKDRLFDLPMQGHALENGVVFFQLQTVRRVFPVFLRDVAGGAGHAGCLVFCAFQNDLLAVSFTLLSHGSFFLKFQNLHANFDAFLFQLHQVGVDAFLVDGAQGVHGYAERDPLVQFRNKETLALQVRLKTALRFAVGVGNVVARDRTLSC